MLGETKVNNFGSEMIIIKYNNNKDIDVFFPKYNWTFHGTTYNCFKNGNIKCPYEPRVRGIGYIGEGKYTSRVNGEKIKSYVKWGNMLNRCYGKGGKRDVTYKECFVCDEWLNFQNFAEWFDNNYYEIPNERMCLDKDILVKGNKIYSPNTCVFTPEKINILFNKNNKVRGDCPIGVTYNKRDKIYEASCCIDKRHQVYLGRYNDVNKAFQVYKEFKENYIKQVADEYKSLIPNKLYIAMYKYEVEITD